VKEMPKAVQEVRVGGRRRRVYQKAKKCSLALSPAVIEGFCPLEA
jgi:hypothetical protein